MEALDDRMEFSYETTRKNNESATRWQLHAGNALPFESDHGSDSYTPQDQHLQYFPQKETRSLKRLIPATWPEVLSYYRAYVTAMCKIEIVSMQYVQFNRFFWYFITNLFLKSLPHTYIQVFLASYAKDDHFFASKMVPVAYGLIFVNIVTAFVQIMTHIDSVILLLDYFINALANKSPWDRCDDENNNTFYSRNIQEYIHCYELDKFADIFKNKQPTFYMLAYKVENNTYSIYGNTSVLEQRYEYFQIPQVVYYLRRADKIIWNSDCTLGETWYFLILWVLINLLSYQLFSKYIWKTLHIVQWAVITIYVCIFIHLAEDFLHGQLENIPHIPDQFSYVYEIVWNFDLHMLAESMTAPPIIHILLSRTSREPRPSGDSSIIVLSNGMYYLFKGLLANRMKKYCDSLVQVPVHLLIGCTNTFYYLWPMYFSTFYLGGLFSMTFFCLHFIMEFLTVVITYQCLLEAVICEWPKAKRFVMTCVGTILGLATYCLLGVEYKEVLYVCMQGAATMLEIIAIYIIYPVDRLIDDITFFSGVIPTRLRILNLRIVPIYYATKLYIMFSSIHYLLMYTYEELESYIWIIFIGPLYVLLMLMIFGALYAVLKKKFIEKKKCQSLFLPDANWGPEFSVRQLRKEYDSREYVGSQAPKLLSRYMIKKAEAKKYTLNIKYDAKSDTKLAGTSAQFRYEDEKKNL